MTTNTISETSVHLYVYKIVQYTMFSLKFTIASYQ